MPEYPSHLVPGLMDAPSPDSAVFARLVLDSHLRLVGIPLGSAAALSDEEAAAWLYNNAPFGLLAHGTGADPHFIYGNRLAQESFGYTWQELTALPSRLSAATDAQDDRAGFVAAVSRQGFAQGYRGQRVRRDGSLFWIEDVTMWDLLDAAGRRHGQAAAFRPGARVHPEGNHV